MRRISLFDFKAWFSFFCIGFIGSECLADLLETAILTPLRVLYVQGEPSPGTLALSLLFRFAFAQLAYQMALRKFVLPSPHGTPRQFYWIRASINFFFLFILTRAVLVALLDWGTNIWTPVGYVWNGWLWKIPPILMLTIFTVCRYSSAFWQFCMQWPVPYPLLVAAPFSFLCFFLSLPNAFAKDRTACAD